MEDESITPLSSNINNGSFPKLSWTGTKIPTLSSSKDVSKGYQQIECLKDHLKDRNEWSDSSGTYYDDPEFKYIGKDTDNPNSCLVVEYYKQTQDNKWWGEFKLIWFLKEKEDTEGLITAFNAKTESGKLKTDASIYLIKKGGNDQKKILANYKQESSEHEITSNDDLSKYFPKIGTSIKNGETDDYWGFGPEIDKICKSNECSNITAIGNTTSKQWTWNHNGSGSEKITSWSSNFDTWFLKFFNSKWNKVKEELEKFKGNWQKG